MSNESLSVSSKMIVVSNRLPFVLEKDKNDQINRKSSAGGLVTAVAPVVVQSGGKVFKMRSTYRHQQKKIFKQYVVN